MVNAMENILNELNGVTPSSYFIGTIALFVIMTICQIKIFARTDDLSKLELRLQQENEKKFLSKEVYNVVQKNIKEDLDEIKQLNNKILEILIGKE